MAQLISQQVCSDPDHHRFLACALAAGINVVVSGDKQLSVVSGWNSIEIL
jgi:predicted nucleic acid-binding protein